MKPSSQDGPRRCVSRAGSPRDRGALESWPGCGSFGRSPSAGPAKAVLRLAFLRALRHVRGQDGRRVLQVEFFRRDVEKQLTEAVIKEITLRTPYKVVGDHDEGRLAADGHDHLRRQEPGGRSPDQPARELNMTINVQVKWTHNPPTEIEDKQLPTIVTETINFVPEVGETTLTATNHVVQSLAKQIVDMMEQPWFNENDVR